MKVLLLILFLINGSFNYQQPTTFNLNTFTSKNVPDHFWDCGDGWYYLSEKDADKTRFICVTDYNMVLIYINHKPLWFKKDGHQSHLYISGKYKLIIKDGPTKHIGYESYKMKSSIVVEYQDKIIWSKEVVGYTC